MWRVCGNVGRYASTYEALTVGIRWRMELRIPFLTHQMMALYLEEAKDCDIEEEILEGYRYEDSGE
ncbi:hypothetical protein N7455_007012 [Penicillium solitum]|uniref:uncharacterized protein n=1 Tax=Penicillium solitum TaxID=60172 RepID=UPI0032C4A100|nr:hypothetical protein N7455_007012 [Penicillium solitum]